MDTLKKYENFFRLVGEAVWHLQHVESVLSTYLTIKSTKPNKEEVANSLKKYRSFTLGQAIKIGKEKNIIPPLMLYELENFKEERNWLIHKSIYQNYTDFLDGKQSKIFLKKINNFTNKAISLYKSITKDLEEFVEQFEFEEKLKKLLIP